MLRLLFYLFAVMVMPGAAQVTFNVSSVFNISSCPITYFGQEYEQLYGNFTGENIALCFNVFYDPQTKGSCLLGNKENRADFQIMEWNYAAENRIHENVPAMNTTMIYSVQVGGQFYSAALKDKQAPCCSKK